MFTSFSAKNFRGFADLKLDGLARVNLIVGRNNSGKTSLLEGLTILSTPTGIGDMPGMFRVPAGDADHRFNRWLVRDATLVENAELRANNDKRKYGVNLVRMSGKKPAVGSNFSRVYSSGTLSLDLLNHSPTLSCQMVSAQDRENHDTVVRAYAQAVKHRGAEEEIEKILNIMDNRVKKVRIDVGGHGTILLADVGLSEMIPLTQAGQGLYRLVSILSHMIGTQPQVCLVDEIENGLHHTVLEQVWTGLAEAASTWNIQIFATTHSYECIEAAHAAFAKRSAYEFSIIQLFRLEQGVEGRVIDRKHIEAALEGDIDLR